MLGALLVFSCVDQILLSSFHQSEKPALLNNETRCMQRDVKECNAVGETDRVWVGGWLHTIVFHQDLRCIREATGVLHSRPTIGMLSWNLKIEDAAYSTTLELDQNKNYTSSH